MAFQNIVDQQITGLVAVKRNVVSFIVSDFNGESVTIRVAGH